MFARFGKADITSLLASVVALVTGFVAGIPAPWDTVLILIAFGAATAFGLLGPGGQDIVARIRELIVSDELTERIAERVHVRLQSPASAELLLLALVLGGGTLLGACGSPILSSIPDAYDSATLRVTSVESNDVLGEITLDLNEQPELRGGFCFEVAVTDADFVVYKQCIEGAYPSSALFPVVDGESPTQALHGADCDAVECAALLAPSDVADNALHDLANTVTP